MSPEEISQMLHDEVVDGSLDQSKAEDALHHAITVFDILAGISDPEEHKIQAVLLALQRSLWTDAEDIDKRPDLHSTAMEIKRLLVVVDSYHFSEPVLGWYLPAAGCWRVEGSPSDHRIIRFMPLPYPLP